MVSLQNMYMILDAAKMGSYIDEAIELNKQYDSLYRGTSQEKLSPVAPYIFDLQTQESFFRWYAENAWGQSWGILLHSNASMAELHKHFRKFLLVQTETGTELYFRFYDPRVLKVFLPTCDKQQTAEIFGPVNYFLIEDPENTQVCKCTQESGILKIQNLNLQEVFDLAVPA